MACMMLLSPHWSACLVGVARRGPGETDLQDWRGSGLLWSVQGEEEEEETVRSAMLGLEAGELRTLRGLPD